MSQISLSQKLWKKSGEFSEEKTLFENFCTLRGKSEDEFVPPVFEDLLDPFLFSDAEKTVKIIFDAIEKKERIMIFGDYDLDGMSGSAILFLGLKTLGAQVSYRLPSRADGYGLSEKFIQDAHSHDVKVFITTDCGISNFKEVENAKKLGMKFIITDHHSIPDQIPNYDAAWHPLLPTENFPDKDLTGAGVAWYFCAALLRRKFGAENSRKIEEELLELAVLGTVADCGSLRGENRKITILGLDHLKNTKNSGLQALLKSSGTHPEKLTAESIGFFLGPRLNAAGRLAHPKTSLELLLGDAGKAEELEKLNRERQDMVKIFVEEAEAQIVLNNTKEFAATIVASEEWLAGVIGLISGKLAERYGKPTIAFAILEDKITGSCRGPENFNIVETLRKINKKNPEYFFGFGGHAEAAGLSLHPEYFQDFCLAYNEEVKNIRGENPEPPFLKYDAELPRKITTAEIKELQQKAQPFGIGNPSPLFKFSCLEVVKIKTVGKDNTHLSLFLKAEYKNATEFLSGIFFQAGEFSDKIQVGDTLDVLALPTINEWQGKESISLQIKDLRKIIES